MNICNTHKISHGTYHCVAIATSLSSALFHVQCVGPIRWLFRVMPLLYLKWRNRRTCPRGKVWTWPSLLISSFAPVTISTFLTEHKHNLWNLNWNWDADCSVISEDRKRQPSGTIARTCAAWLNSNTWGTYEYAQNIFEMWQLHAAAAAVSAGVCFCFIHSLKNAVYTFCIHP